MRRRKERLVSIDDWPKDFLQSGPLAIARRKYPDAKAFEQLDDGRLVPCEESQATMILENGHP